MTNPVQAGIAPSIAIVGSGPAGCYTAQFCRKAWPDAEITVFEAAAVPYGLIRYGIAADHQGTKEVVRQFERLFDRAGVRFAGNVRIGTDLPFDALTAAFDVVVLATGIRSDRPLGIPQEPGARVVGAGALMRALNGHPGALDEVVQSGGALGERLALIGNGNVAIDVLRVLLKSADAFHGSDIDDHALETLRPQPIAQVQVIGRSAPARARFDPAMVKEFAALPGILRSVRGTGEPDDERVLEMLTGTAAHAPVEIGGETQQAEVVFHFRLVPERIALRDGATILSVRDAVGELIEIEVDTVITAIGFSHHPESPDLTQDWAGAGVYRVGWASGSHGALPQNRREAKELVDRIASDLAASGTGEPSAGFAAIAPLIADRAVYYADWLRIDAHETGAAPAGRTRVKVVDHEQMLAIAREDFTAE